MNRGDGRLGSIIRISLVLLTPAVSSAGATSALPAEAAAPVNEVFNDETLSFGLLDDAWLASLDVQMEENPADARTIAEKNRNLRPDLSEEIYLLLDRNLARSRARNSLDASPGISDSVFFAGGLSL